MHSAFHSFQYHCSKIAQNNFHQGTICEICIHIHMQFNMFSISTLLDPISREQQLFFHFYAFLVDIPAAGNLVCFLDHVAHVLLHGL